MRISDWSSDVCSSDLLFPALRGKPIAGHPLTPFIKHSRIHSAATETNMKSTNKHLRLSTVLGKLTQKKLLAGALLGLAACGTPAMAAYPTTPISLIVHFPAGSVTDASRRIFAQEPTPQLA